MDSPRGNAIVGQSGGVTAVINSSLAGVVEESLKQGQITGIFGMRYGIQGLLAGKIVDLGAESPATLSALRRTPAAALGTCRYKLAPEDPARVVETCRQHNIRYFFYIGGNDSADTSHRIAIAAADAGYDLRVVGVPKTIDNDLPLMDHTPGYGSIARFVAMATADAGRDTEAARLVDPIKLIEVSGRNAGWVAAASALGRHAPEDAPHLIYFPERPISVDRFLDDVQRAYDEHGYAVVVLTETVRDEEGRPLAHHGLAEQDAFGHARLAGAAERLTNLVCERLGLRARWDKPGTIQRTLMAAASPVDLEEAYLVGQMAVRYALAGEHDKMVALQREPGDHYRAYTTLVPLSAVANNERRLPDNFISPAGNHVTSEFLAYARPLIGPPIEPYPRLRNLPVRR